MYTSGPHIRRLSYGTALVAAALLLAACGSSSSSGTTPPAASGGSAATGKTVRVTLANYTVTLAGGNHLAPGAYTFMATNQSGTGHNLTINGPGVSDQATPTFTSGTKPLTVTLKPGT